MRAALAFLELSSPLVFLLALKIVDSLLRFIMLDFSTYTSAFLSFCDMGGWAQQTAVASLLFPKRQKPKSHTISLFLR